MNCVECQKEVPQHYLTNGICVVCLDEGLDDGIVDASSVSHIILTTESAHDLHIAERLEIISAECVLGMNIFNDIGAAVRDLVGGRNQTFQTKLREARKTVLDELKREAHQLGADAVVAVDLDYSEISGGGKSMLFVVATGTAVRLATAPTLA